MNQSLPNTPLSAQDDEAKTHALIAYALMLTGLLTVVFWLVGGIQDVSERKISEQLIIEKNINQKVSKIKDEALADLSEEPILDTRTSTPPSPDLTDTQLEALADLDDDEIFPHDCVHHVRAFYDFLIC